MQQPLLEVSNLCVSYGPVQALVDIDLKLYEKEILTIIGANGAGKSTTLRAISGLIPLQSGRIQFAGEDLTKLKPHEVVKRRISHSPEGRGIFPQLTVMENLDLGAYSVNDKKSQRTFDEDLDEVLTYFPHLKARLKQEAGTLSGGEQQMLAISRALMSRPRMLLLDEPSLGLAPKIIETIFVIIQRINEKGVSVLLVEQNAMLALEIAHRALVLETGRCVMRGDAKELLASDEIKRAYLGGD